MARAFQTILALVFTLGTSGVSPAMAHEFWLLPEDFTLDAGAQVRVSLRNGQNMVGVDLPYLPANLPRFEVVIGDTVTPIPARTGDMPAIALSAPATGLAVFVTETSALSLKYDDFAKFQRFVEHKGMPEAVALHTARGLPATGFVENFKRYSKSLVAIGDGAGADRAMGLRIEIVALANPYTDDMTQGLPLQVLLDGQPRAAAQLSLFETAPDGTVTETFFTTDESGQATVPVKPGGIYMADSVDIYALPNNDATLGPVWHSDWASLTFQVP